MQCPTHKKQLSKLAQRSPERKCEMCGREAELQCKECKFTLCSQCRICLKRHFLVKMVELSKVKVEYYTNSYCCNTCNKNKISDDDGLWHCSQCSFDVCPDCTD